MLAGRQRNEPEEESDGQRERVGELNCSKIEKTVQSAKWWGFAIMIQALHGVVALFQQWAEACPCHWSPEEFTAEQLRAWARLCRDLDISEQEGPHIDCPLRGLRAPELAAGDWRFVLNHLVAVCLQKILAQIDFLEPQDISDIVHDWEEGKKHVFAVLELKLRPWSCMPWVFAGLAHHDTDTARRVARDISDTWNALDAPARSFNQQHPLTMKLMTQQPYCDQFHAFLGGADLQELAELLVEVARLRFIPVAERCVEALHGLIHVRGHYRKVTLAFISLVIRLPAWEKQVKRKADVLTETLCALQTTRNTRRL